MASVDLSSITDTFIDTNWDVDEADISTKIYGRTTEASILLNTYLEVLRTKKSSTVIVHGHSGVGKTSLVDSLREHVVNNNGYFCSGKYFQDSGGVQEPYSAIIAAFSDLCDLVIQSSSFSEERQLEIRQGLGSDGVVLSKSITNLSPLLDQPYHGHYVDHVRTESAFVIFKVACKRFLQTMACDYHPVVMFLDDVQWMDEGSRQVTKMILNDKDLKNVMLILSYREEEAEKVQDLFSKDCFSKEQTVDIALENLTSEGVLEIVSALLNSSSVDARQLSEIVTQKTRGNTFHVLQFLEMIQMEELLIFDADASRWIFDVDEIQQEMMVTDSLADILLRQIQRLPAETQSTLQVAALLGFRFQEDTVAEILTAYQCGSNCVIDDLGSLSTKTSSLLQDAVKIGLIEEISQGYQFSHDRIQEAFRSMLTKEEQEKLHLVMGETFLAWNNADSAYHAALHLHAAPAFASTTENRVKLARINLDAAKYCREKSAFNDALVFLCRGLYLLGGEEKWINHFDLAFELTELRAKMELIVGNVVACKDMTEEALRRATTIEAKIGPLLIDVEVRMTGNEMDETIFAANRALQVLGIKMPRKAGLRHVLLKLWKVKKMIGKKTDEMLLNLPKMDDLSMETAVRVLLHLCMYCNLRDEDIQSAYSALLAMELTLKCGLAPQSSSAFVMYGMAELSLGNHQIAYRFGKLALKLQEQTQDRDSECPAIGLALTLLTHWMEPIREKREILFETARRGLVYGDIVYGTYCLSNCYGIDTILGSNLVVLEDSIKISYHALEDLGQHDAMVDWLQPAYQWALNLQNHEATNWCDLTVLTGDIMNESEYLAKAKEGRHLILFVMAWAFKATLELFFGFPLKAEAIYKDMAKMGPSFHVSYAHGYATCLAGMASFGAYKQTGCSSHLRLARKFKAKLQRVEGLGSTLPPAFMALLNAEEKSCSKSVDPSMVADSYDYAIKALSEVQVSHVHGFANEQAGFYQVAQGNLSKASEYFTRAMAIYRDDWGSTAKYQWLFEKHRTICAAIISNEKMRFVNEILIDHSNSRHQDEMRMEGRS